MALEVKVMALEVKFMSWQRKELRHICGYSLQLHITSFFALGLPRGPMRPMSIKLSKAADRAGH